VRLVLVNGALLAAIGLAILGVTARDRAEVSVEAAVRRYAAAVTSMDLEAALDEVAPDQREDWRPWLTTQLGNIYDVRGIAVRSPSLADQIVRRAPNGPIEVSVVLDVNRDYPEEFYEPTARVPVEQVNGRWYLSRPLLARP
jgi:hypothetical protein